MSNVAEIQHETGDEDRRDATGVHDEDVERVEMESEASESLHVYRGHRVSWHFGGLDENGLK